MTVTRVDKVVRSLHGWQENSCNQDLSDFTLEAVQVVFNLHFYSLAELEREGDMNPWGGNRYLLLDGTEVCVSCQCVCPTPCLSGKILRSDHI